MSATLHFLYNESLKALAHGAHGAGRLEAADASLRLDNPLCGDRIDLHLRWSAGPGTSIAALAHETKGCLLCRAAASILGLHALGCSAEEIFRVAAELEALLVGGIEKPSWTELELFTPVAAHPSRHGCVTLPFRALSQLLQER